MARTATTFEKHTKFGPFPFVTAEDGTVSAVILAAEGLTTENAVVIGSDKDSEASGEFDVPQYAIADGYANPLSAALALFGGSQEKLANAAINSFNDGLRVRAKNEAATRVIGPEKALAATLDRVARALKIDAKVLKARAKENPEYISVLLQMASID